VSSSSEADEQARDQDHEYGRGGEGRVVHGREAQDVVAEHHDRQDPHPPAAADRLPPEELTQPPERPTDQKQDDAADDDRRSHPEEHARRRGQHVLAVDLAAPDQGDHLARCQVDRHVGGDEEQRPPEAPRLQKARQREVVSASAMVIVSFGS